MSSEWGEYSKLVLKELETLSVGIRTLNESMNKIESEIAGIKAREDKVIELLEWKEKVVDVVSPTQLKELKDKVNKVEAVLNQKELRVEELIEWKKRVDDIVSPAQLKDHVETIDDLKAFKTKAITIFAVVQFLIVLISFGLKFI